MTTPKSTPTNKRGKIQCPICKGVGTLTEDTNEYEFITRDPITNRCLFCDGSGYVGARKRLPDSTTPNSTVDASGKLNISSKRKPPAPNPRPKHMITVAESDPCYFEVFRLVRKHRKPAGEWNEFEEAHYVTAMENHIKKLEDSING